MYIIVFNGHMPACRNVDTSVCRHGIRMIVLFMAGWRFFRTIMLISYAKFTKNIACNKVVSNKVVSNRVVELSIRVRKRAPTCLPKTNEGGNHKLRVIRLHVLENL